VRACVGIVWGVWGWIHGGGGCIAGEGFPVGFGMGFSLGLSLGLRIGLLVGLVNLPLFVAGVESGLLGCSTGSCHERGSSALGHEYGYS
jgi:hypothetical protein